MSDIVAWLDERAKAVSNLGRPREDNQYGRAAATITQLRELVREFVECDGKRGNLKDDVDVDYVNGDHTACKSERLISALSRARAQVGEKP